MSSTLQEHPPQARCYQCGSITIAHLCHHCGKPMCEQHGSRVGDTVGKPISQEFADLELDQKQVYAYHCDEHDHVVKGDLKKMIGIGIAVAVLGILLLLVALVFGLLVTLAGAGLIGLAIYLQITRKAALLANPPPLPLFPTVDSITVLETLQGRVSLDDDGYHSAAEQVKGDLDVVLTLGRADRDRAGLYRAKYQLAGDAPIEYSGGFGLIKGEAGLSFDALPSRGSRQHASGPALLPSGTAISFGGQLSEHPVLQGSEARNSAQWKISLPYHLHHSRTPDSVPIWIVPSLVPASDQRTLEVDLHWVMFGDKRRQLTLSRFDEVELTVPTGWGNIESATGPFSISNSPADRTRTIHWTPKPASHARGRSITLTARFQHQIRLHGQSQDADDFADYSVNGDHPGQDTAEEPEPRIRGRLKASFNGTLSGITDVAVFPANGGSPSKVEASVRTEVTVEFDLSLKSVRYQDVRRVPDLAKDADKSQRDNFTDVIPDDLTITDLTDAMSQSGYYVKRVIENPPRGGGRANLVNRYWDIAGRRYQGVYPIDFHMTVTGEEEHGGNTRANAGNTATQITVQGSYVNRSMEDQVVHEWDELHGLIEDKLKERAAMASAFPRRDRYSSGPSFTGASDPGYQAPPSAPPPASPPPPQFTDTPVPPQPTAADHDTSGRRAELRRRLDAATDRFIDGNMTEDTYNSIKARIEAELASSS